MNSNPIKHKDIKHKGSFVSYASYSFRHFSVADVMELQKSLIKDIDKSDVEEYPPILPDLIEKLWHTDATIHLLSIKRGIVSYAITYPVVNHKDSLLADYIDTSFLEGTHYLEHVYTPHNLRGKGYGKVLLKVLCLDLKHIQLHVRETNPAMGLYDDLGFIILDRIPNYYYDEGPEGAENAISMVFKFKG